MQVAAVIFLVSGLAYFGWGLSLMFTQGVDVDILLMVVFVAALLYQAYDLFRDKPGARWRGIISSSAIALASAYVASVIFMLPQFPLESLLELPAEAWPVLAAPFIVSVAHATVVVLLALGKSRPNPVVERKP